MKLLVLTQKVDRDDPILGFFHNWLIKLSTRFEGIIVICLGKGEYDLPSNVSVFSLGKENLNTNHSLLTTKFRYILTFYRYIWTERGNYDSVFVHMNQEYVLLGWKLWRLWGKKIYMWRNHKKGSLLTKWAVFVSTNVFYTSPESFTAKFKKSIKMPVGIDTDIFKEGNIERKKNSILSIGRISPVKNIHLMLDVARILKDRGVDFSLDIVGDPVNPEDFEYKNKLVSSSKDLIDSGLVNFLPAVPNYKTPNLYVNHEIFLNLTPSGSFDKTILEASTFGCIPFVHAKIENSFGGIYIENLDSSEIAYSLQGWFEDTSDGRKNEIRNELKNYVFQNHSLNALMDKLCITIRK